MRWFLLLACCPALAQDPAYRSWPSYGGGPDHIRYSRLSQITPANVAQLREAWRFDSGDEFPGSEMQCNPIVVAGVLYATTPKLHTVALDAKSGRLLWRFDPHDGREVKSKFRNRGVTYFGDGASGRIFVPVRNWLYALDAKTGRPLPAFGRDGRIDLRENLGRPPAAQNVGLTTPGVIYKDLLILGSIVSEGLPSSPGHIRAYDARSGALRWTFRTIPAPGDFGYDTWPKDAHQYIGGANNWTGMALDENRGLVFVPTGSAAFDFYGANRAGDNLFANSLLALDAATGRRVWHFQFVRHDVWDRDLPAPPSLVTLSRGGRSVDAVAQITKSGHVFVFERATGKPLFPIEYRDVPTAGVDDEVLAARQPLPLQPPPFARQVFSLETVTRRTPQARAAALEKLKGIQYGGQFVPPSRAGAIVFPGFDGGGEWGGAAFDPETGYLYVNSNEMAWILRLVERQTPALQSGKSIYLRQCASCHRDDLKGTPPEFPSLVRIGDRRNQDELRTVILNGAGRMPAYASLSGNAMTALVDYLLTGRDTVAASPAAAASPGDQKYTHDGYNKFLDPDGYPAISPPWGTLNAIDLNRGAIAWSIPFGEFPALAVQGVPPTGTENYGGPIVTANGLLFIGATNHDRKFRAFDKHSGKLLWETTLPAAGNATPAMYEIDGRQFIVIACGGGKSGAPSGGAYVAFALPEKPQ